MFLTFVPFSSSYQFKRLFYLVGSFPELPTIQVVFKTYNNKRIWNKSKNQVFWKFQKKNEQYKKRIVRFSLQFIKPKRLLSRPRLIYSRISHYHYPLIMSLFLVSVKFFQRLIDGTNGKSHNTVIVAINCFDKRTSQALDTICACFISIITSC